MVIVTIDGLASNLALTVPLALVVLFGAFGSAAERWLLHARPAAVVERRPSDRERARLERERARRSRQRMEGTES